ncbi:hypothetical protein [Psychrobium sp. 1_MG-2023]|uniref:hypothetical protein n=1 Tax=Psychrobium sp. 1_MG-2023 TaxID=3062624 RepID=UPI000C33A69C|nr:hypothetical protein [Psychrobium sp. 1_MG-2023]MDP2561191.1 hypothetical protein [Psychrobium sp. 1_MG-2023]PKF55304.1 hypothetical protein CW748_13895 [Alteromonadales bacterium alter-6D02]
MQVKTYSLKTEQMIQLLEALTISLYNNEDKIDSLAVGEFGRYDDFVYAEIIQHDLAYLLPQQREAIMKVVRELVSATAQAYSSLFDEYIESLEELSLQGCSGAKSETVTFLVT